MGSILLKLPNIDGECAQLVDFAIMQELNYTSVPSRAFVGSFAGPHYTAGNAAAGCALLVSPGYGTNVSLSRALYCHLARCAACLQRRLLLPNRWWLVLAAAAAVCNRLDPHPVAGND